MILFEWDKNKIRNKWRKVTKTFDMNVYWGWYGKEEFKEFKVFLNAVNVDEDEERRQVRVIETSEEEEIKNENMRDISDDARVNVLKGTKEEKSSGLDSIQVEMLWKMEWTYV